eukprot:scaffold10191_cov108-Isochrysis_galbana.AAC.13
MAPVTWVSLLAARPAHLMATRKWGSHLCATVHIELAAWHQELGDMAGGAQLHNALFALVPHLAGSDGLLTVAWYEHLVHALGTSHADKTAAPATVESSKHSRRTRLTQPLDPSSWRSDGLSWPTLGRLLSVAQVAPQIELRDALGLVAAYPQRVATQRADCVDERFAWRHGLRCGGPLKCEIAWNVWPVVSALAAEEKKRVASRQLVRRRAVLLARFDDLVYETLARVRDVTCCQSLEAARQGDCVAAAEARRRDEFVTRRVELLEIAELAAGARETHVTTAREGERRLDDSVALRRVLRLLVARDWNVMPTEIEPARHELFALWQGALGEDTCARQLGRVLAVAPHANLLRTPRLHDPCDGR